jgi:hypothetical protein
MIGQKREMRSDYGVPHPVIDFKVYFYEQVRINSETIYGQAWEGRDDYPMGIVDFRAVPRVGNTRASPENI